ncbi:MAG: sigma factor [Actinomycetota bacterium]|nr:sigma factor [Actinomycetota bacterium]
MRAIRRSRDERPTLDDWLRDWYAPAYRTAYLVLLDRHEAERAVHEGFLRAWRMRSGVVGGSDSRAWVMRAVLNACTRHLGQSAPGQVPEGWRGPAGRLRDLAGLEPALRRPLALLVGGLDHRSIAEVTRRRADAVEKDLDEVIARLACESGAGKGGSQ